jgi:hypothetical protein
MSNKITNGNIITRLAPRACMYFLYKYIYSLLYMYLYRKINGLGGYEKGYERGYAGVTKFRTLPPLGALAGGYE